MTLDARYNPQEAEARWQRFWEEHRLYAYDPDSEQPVYSIDTPPPTVSGKLHIGHVFSYTQTEIIARYQRMRGCQVVYPFGFDDNGLPTEILTERERGVRGSELPREEFVRLCEEVSAEFRGQFRQLWQRLGFSCDWDSAYSTISASSQRISQRSFLDLLERGRVEFKEMPTQWCVKCRTVFAQAEVDDVQKGTTFHYLHFHTVDGQEIPVATTRPELLAGCVAVFIHPQHPQYGGLIGQRAVVPLFGQEVEIRADEKADPEKGTGVVMCCTFGDVTDIDWWREHELELRICLNEDGTMNERAGEFAGLTIEEARAAIVARLEAEGLIFKQEELAAESRVVNVHERCGTPVEFLPIKQWFIKVVDRKQELLEQGRKIRWFPPYMGKRYADWVENLGWDWAISRQRFFGVSIPVWYAPDGSVVPASPEQLPVHPLTDKPLDCRGYDPETLVPERDVLDTWATSSVTPQLIARWGEADEDPKLRPVSMRPQAHDIIRTWAFYTIVKSLYHFDDVPWRDAVISGHVIKKEVEVEAQQVAGKDFARKSKISKSKDGDNFSPTRILEEFGADPVRYWTSSGTLGTDIQFDEEEIRNVNKLLTKLWNSSRFAASFLEGFEPTAEPELRPLDVWALERFNRVVEAYHKAFERYEFYPARNELERYFWGTFCDNYLELVKYRLWRAEEDPASAYAAQWTLYRLLLGQLALFGPYIPHITEELYQALFRETEGTISLHVRLFPEVEARFDDAAARRSGDLLVELVTLVRGYKSQHNHSMKMPVARLEVRCSKAEQTSLEPVVEDLQAVTSTREVVFVRGVEEAGLSIEVKMDAAALRRAEVVTAIKPTINEAKKALGLKARQPVAELLVQAEGELLELLQAEPKQLAAAAKAGQVTFQAEGVAHQPTAVEGIAVAVRAGA